MEKVDSNVKWPWDAFVLQVLHQGFPLQVQLPAWLTPHPLSSLPLSPRLCYSLPNFLFQVFYMTHWQCCFVLQAPSYPYSSFQGVFLSKFPCLQSLLVSAICIIILSSLCLRNTPRPLGWGGEARLHSRDLGVPGLVG